MPHNGGGCLGLQLGNERFGLKLDVVGFPARLFKWPVVIMRVDDDNSRLVAGFFFAILDERPVIHRPSETDKKSDIQL